MKLLITTQKLDKNDPVLGFFHRWVEEFAKHCERVTVICLEKGEYNLPENVEVFSLGKEKNSKFYIINFPIFHILYSTFFSRSFYVLRFYQYIWRERKSYDAVFVHMNPEYAILGGPVWRLARKTIALWYVHLNVDLKLKLAERFAHVVLSAAKESFRLPSRKLHVVGHGIDAERYRCRERKSAKHTLSILHVGRITRIKNCDILLDAAKILREKLNKPFKITFIGAAAAPEDAQYEHMLKKAVASGGLGGTVEFIGNVPHEKMPRYYCGADLTVNLTPTGGVDKAVLESMAAGVPALSSNRAFKDYFGRYADDLLFEEGNAGDLVEKLVALSARKDKSDVGAFLRGEVLKKASIEKLVQTILQRI